MGGWLGGQTETEELSKPTYVVERGSPFSRALPFFVAIAILGALGFIALRVFQSQFAPAIRVAELEAENARLTEMLGSARMQAELDAATREELERQLAELSEQVKQLSEEVSFYKRAQSSKK